MLFGRIFLFCLVGMIAGCVTNPHGASHDTNEAAVVAQGLDKDKIRQTIREHIVPIRHCYEKELKTNPGHRSNFGGKLVLEWDIGDLGKVTRVAVRKAFHPKVDECVAAVIQGTLFETPPRGTIGNVVFPFEFNPNPDKAVK